MRLSPSVALLRTQSDDRLVALARDGSEAAFTALVERYRRMVVRACGRVLSESRAEDAAQQVFMSAWKALRRGDEVREVRPWLLRIARNTALNALRVPGYDYDEIAESLSAGEAPQAELERREVVRATLAGLAGLPERQREALLRSAVQGASHADIAQALGVGEGAARMLVLRARNTLRAAATAVTPAPLLTWALTRAGEPGLAEAVAGGSAAGTAGVLAKAGVVAALAGGAVATPVIVHRSAGGDPVPAARAAERPPVASRTAAPRRATTSGAVTASRTATPAARPRPADAGAMATKPEAGARPTRRVVVRRAPAPVATAAPRHREPEVDRERERDHEQQDATAVRTPEPETEHGGSEDATPTPTAIATATPTPAETSDDRSGSDGGSGDPGASVDETP